jgi:hypothetical protein
MRAAMRTHSQRSTICSVARHSTAQILRLHRYYAF